jgi:uncharacterized spore protein YtfJ
MSNLNSSIETMFNNLEGIISSKTVVGEAINIGDVIILPLVDVSFGLGAGNYDKSVGSDIGKNPVGGGGGGMGASVTPSAVLVIQNGNVQLVNIKNQDSINKLIDLAPSVITKITSLFKKEKNEEDDDDSDERM